MWKMNNVISRTLSIYILGFIESLPVWIIYAIDTYFFRIGHIFSLILFLLSYFLIYRNYNLFCRLEFMKFVTFKNFSLMTFGCFSISSIVLAPAFDMIVLSEIWKIGVGFLGILLVGLAIIRAIADR